MKEFEKAMELKDMKYSSQLQRLVTILKRLQDRPLGKVLVDSLLVKNKKKKKEKERNQNKRKIKS